jgi:hypothetical protein
MSPMPMDPDSALALHVPPRIEWKPVFIAAALFSVLSLMTGFASEAFLEADACAHYLCARFALAEPYRFVDVWGRPICTLIYSVPAALFGRGGTRITSLLMALTIGWIALRIARRQGMARPALALVFTLAQPLVFTHSFSELTELPFALLAGAAFLAYQSRRFTTLAAVASLMPLCRPEGFGFLLMALIALLFHRNFAAIVLLPLGLIAWNHAGWVMYGQTDPWYRWLADHWPWAAESVYQPGYLLHFVASLPAVVSPFVFPATLVGIVLGLGALRRARGRWGQWIGDHHARCDFLIVAIPLSMLLVHSLLYWRGLMASNGELRYMLTVAPFWGILAAQGYNWIVQRISIQRVYTWAAIACLAPLSVNYFYTVFPLRLDANWRTARAVATALAHNADDEAYPYVMASHIGIFYFLDVSPTDGTRVKDLSAANIASPPPGTRLIWDSLFASFNADRQRIIRKEDILAAGWVPDEMMQAVIDRKMGGHAIPTGGALIQPIRPVQWLAFKSPPLMRK